MGGLTIYQDEISLSLELYHNSERLPVRVVSIGDQNEQTGEFTITIQTVRGFPPTFTNTRPEAI